MNFFNIEISEDLKAAARATTTLIDESWRTQPTKPTTVKKPIEDFKEW